ncbi:MAG TPA: PDZ domain-containing protein [Clostridiaceae bacterium]|nr:PDZ domain-containing protein [Clostridiaceae bacterium]
MSEWNIDDNNLNNNYSNNSNDSNNSDNIFSYSSNPYLRESGSDRIPVFYTENYSKAKQKKNKSNIGQLILVAILSSILGGSVVFAAFQFVAPAIQPAINGYLGNVLGQNVYESNKTQAVDNTIRRYEIEKVDSPVIAIAEEVSPSIVGVRTTTTIQNFFYGTMTVPGEGSGIILRSDGYILTNNHVIEAAMADNMSNTLVRGAKIEVFLPGKKDTPYEAKVVGRDPKTDLAVLKIEATGLPAATFGDSDELRPGELAVAIGNPGGLDFMGSVTAGVISGLNRSIKTEDGKVLTLIQTDAAINPGNSGGALVNSKGEVIGINTIKIAASGYEGLGFAIPSNTALDIANSLIEYKRVKGRLYLGISINPNYNEVFAKRYNLPVGLLVVQVEPMSAAYKAGIRENDIITKFNKKSMKTFDELEAEKDKLKVGDVVEVEVYRDSDKKTYTFNITMEEMPEVE